MPSRYYEDLTPGQTIHHRLKHTVSEADSLLDEHSTAASQ